MIISECVYVFPWLVHLDRALIGLLVVGVARCKNVCVDNVNQTIVHPHISQYVVVSVFYIFVLSRSLRQYNR